MAEVFSVLKAENPQNNEHIFGFYLGLCRFKNMKLHLLIQYAKKSSTLTGTAPGPGCMGEDLRELVSFEMT